MLTITQALTHHLLLREDHAHFQWLVGRSCHACHLEYLTALALLMSAGCLHVANVQLHSWTDSSMESRAVVGSICRSSPHCWHWCRRSTWCRCRIVRRWHWRCTWVRQSASAWFILAA